MRVACKLLLGIVAGAAAAGAAAAGVAPADLVKFPTLPSRHFSLTA